MIILTAEEQEWLCNPNLYNAYVNITKSLKYKPKVIYLTPQGKVFNQNMAKEMSKTTNT